MHDLSRRKIDFREEYPKSQKMLRKNAVLEGAGSPVFRNSLGGIRCTSMYWKIFMLYRYKCIASDDRTGAIAE